MRIRRVVATADTPPPRGFPRWAWWTVLLSILLFAAPLTSPWWSTILRSEIPGAADEEDEVPGFGSDPDNPPAETVVPGSTLKLTLHLPGQGGAELRAVNREVPYVRGFLAQVTAAAAELGVGTPEVLPLLPPGTRVLDTAYASSGTIFIDFSAELEMGRGLGAAEETMLVQGIVTTIMENFSAVRRVVILVDGKTPGFGHLDLSRPFRLDDPLFVADVPPAADDALTAAPSPKAAPARPAAAPPPASPVPTRK